MAPTAKPLGITTTPIPGFLRIDLTVHGDNRGWFKENWQREKMVALGLPDFQPVQNNISFNDEVGVTRGIHAEPWDKFVSVATGRVFGAWVDLREGPSFGTVYTTIIDPSVAVFVPKGVGNSYQTLEPNTAYTYLVNDHWSPDAKYTFLNLADETAAVDWPIPLERAILSDKDKAHPRMADVTPFPAPTPAGRRALVTGANGQLGRRSTWEANATGPAVLAREATAHGATLVHISTEYVFDGTQEVHVEDEAPSPLSAYGQSKAGGDAAVASTPKHYIVRTSWVVGDGKNFIKTMASLADRGISPSVVSDQVGRLTFTADLAQGIIHLLTNEAPYGVYNLSGEGPVMSWAQVAKRVFELCGRNPEDVTEVTTEEYFAGREAAPRPLSSTLDLSKIEATGFTPADSSQRIDTYVASLRS